MKNGNVITNPAQGRHVLGIELTSLVQDWAIPREQELEFSKQEEDEQMQQLTSGKLSSPQQHFFG